MTSWNDVGKTLTLTLDEEELTRCMRCGFCLPACPTYRETGREAASPRGRIALMKAVHEGRMIPDSSFQKQMDFCLGCRACESDCPADVHFGHLLEQSRAAIVSHAPSPTWKKYMRKFFFHALIPHRRRLRLVGAFLALYQRSGIQRLLHRSGLSKWLMPSHLQQVDEVLPLASPYGIRERVTTERLPAIGTPLGRVALFQGCIMDVLFAKTNHNTAKVLQAAGYDVIISKSQTCCGALHAHSGEEEKARLLAQQNIKGFQGIDIDWIVSNAGGCGAHLIDYPYLLKDDPQWATAAQSFAHRIKDVSELLVDGHSLNLQPIHERVTYQDSCHLRNGMKVIKEPRTLLNTIPEIDYIELVESDRCCGSAGIYNLTHPQTSQQLLDEKMQHLHHTRAAILVTSNPGCLIQMKVGIQRAGLENHMRAVHLVDLLIESMEGDRT
ncbi:glycolate oxidase iron-sulfur subunit [Marininema mesophilum]|uniref:Glycolate oxidase iron-sulfur subunit n=1 Tax=Marininema mesophilum TaxID=1048340 RepID=A0A1H3C2A1_9BACL|nr:(Fe-S)-binding protein [Marininema mesophilum]SDX48292.1 glycolate oxidase iron-sulfur subunit [Marininema mesophilum]